MILADTSAWIEYDRATGSLVHRRMRELLARPHELAVTEPVVMEVLGGAKTDDRMVELTGLLRRPVLLRLDAAIDFDGAARVYRMCRRAGVTPRGLVDCLIATVAWRHGASLLALDADLTAVARVLGIPVEPDP